MPPSIIPNQTCFLSQYETSFCMVWLANMLGRHLIRYSSCPSFRIKTFLSKSSTTLLLTFRPIHVNFIWMFTKCMFNCKSNSKYISEGHICSKYLERNCLHPFSAFLSLSILSYYLPFCPSFVITSHLLLKVTEIRTKGLEVWFYHNDFVSLTGLGVPPD